MMLWLAGDLGCGSQERFVCYDLSASGINQTVQTVESPKPHFIAAMLLEVLKCSNGSP